MNKKVLQDEIRYIKDLLDSKETELGKIEKEENNCCCGCCNCEEYETELKNVEVNINISCNDTDLQEILQDYISEVVADALDEFFDDEDEEDFDEDDEYDIEISFLPFTNKKTGEIIGVAMRKLCNSCGTDIIENIFTDGSDEAEMMAIEMGYRD